MGEDTPTNRKAIALRYQLEKDNAPRIIAKGSGYVADRILELAREHDVPLHNDPDLVAVLARLNVNQEIPENLYRAVAEILAFVYRLNQSIEPR